MTIHLSPAQSRIAALAILIVSAAIMVLLVAWPAWRLNKHYDEAIEDSADRLARYRRVAAARPAIEEAIAAVNQRDARKNYYQKCTTPALAAAELQSTIAAIVEANGARIFSSQTLPVKTDAKTPAGPNEIGVTVQMTASIVPLHLILHAIETHQPYLFVGQLSVRGNQGRTYRPVPGQQPEFVVQATVRGYCPPDTPKS